MIKTYKILSLLLSYPSKELQAFLPEVEAELNSESLLNDQSRSEVALFVKHYYAADLTDWQAEYVQLFDYSRSASLHLFEHIKGDSKDRGQAMVDMMEFYKEYDLEMDSNELPDYIPLFLEFLSILTVEQAAELLAEPVHIIHRVYMALLEKENLYRHIIAAIVSLSAKQPDQKVTDAVIKAQKPLNLDEEYAEEPVEFTGPNSCQNCKK